MSRYSSEKYYELPVLQRKEALPLENNTIGDRYLFDDELYIWNGEFWVEARLLSAPPSLLIQQYILSGPSSVDEGVDFTIQLATQNVDNNTEIPYTISGTVQTTDLDNASLTGVFTVVDNSAQITFTHTADGLSDGPKTFLLSLDNDADSIQINLLDTSQQPVPTYTLTSSASSVDEGDSFTVTLTTTAVPEGTVVPYIITGISASDLTAPGETSLTGNFTIDAVGSSGKSFNISEDTTTEGTEIFTLSLTGQSSNIQVNINDTSQTTITTGSQLFTNLGQQTWTVPDNVTSVSVVCIGGGGGGQGSIGTSSGNVVSAGGGGGGGLGWKNNITVIPGDTITLQVGARGAGGTKDGYNNGSGSGRTNGSGGGDSWFLSSSTVLGRGGAGGSVGTGALGGTYAGDGGGNGGNGFGTGQGWEGCGGGGAGGYQGPGGNAGPNVGSDGTGGGGGGGASDNYTGAGGFTQTGAQGGGTYTNGRGTSGLAGTWSSSTGNPTSGTSGSQDVSGGGSAYGGGGGGRMGPYYSTSSTGSAGTQGAVRVRWGTDKDYP